MNSLIKSTTIVTSLALSCSAAFAAESLKATVVAVEGGKVTIETASPPPAWLNQGSSVQALGWPTKVVSAEGSKIVLESTPSRLSKVKVASDVVVQEISKTERFGC